MSSAGPPVTDTDSHSAQESHSDVPSASSPPAPPTIITSSQPVSNASNNVAASADPAVIHQSKILASQQHSISKNTFLTKRVFKVIVIGDPNVGKTCLSFRYCNGRFPEKTEATIGVDFRERSLTLDDQLIRVQIWDTAGQERFRQSMTTHYYRNVHAVVLVYDVTRAPTFANLSHWIDECHRHGVDFRTTPSLIIGNKCDCPTTTIAVATHQAQKWADSLGLPLFETSAKADSQADHVESIFMTLVHKLKDSKSMSLSGGGAAPQAGSDKNNDIVVPSSTDQQAADADDSYCGC